MCLTDLHDSTKARRMNAIGSACLVLVLSQHAFVPATLSETAHHWLNAISCLLLVTSITFNLYALRLRKRGSH